MFDCGGVYLLVVAGELVVGGDIPEQACYFKFWMHVPQAHVLDDGGQGGTTALLEGGDGLNDEYGVLGGGGGCGRH